MTKDALDDYPSKQEILKVIFDAVYAQYPKKEWQGLTYDEVENLANFWNISDIGIEAFIAKIEHKLKEKNHG
jgi:hypothetical protein